MPPRSVLPGNIAGAVANWILGGVSQRGALKLLRSPEVGLKVGDARFRQIWNTTKMTIERRPLVSSMPTNRVPNHDDFVPWGAGKPGMYAYQVNVIVRDAPSGITSSRPYTFFSPTRVVPNTAIADAINTYQDGLEENPEYEGERIEGAVLTGLSYTVERV